MLFRKIVSVSSENHTQNIVHFLARTKGLNIEGGNFCTLILWLGMGTSGCVCVDVKLQMWRHYFPNVLCTVYFSQLAIAYVTWFLGTFTKL